MKPVIYQIVLRYFGNTNITNRQDGTIEANGCGKFADITETALQALKDFGVTYVWLTGCLRQATLTGYPDIGLPADDPDVVKGRAGWLRRSMAKRSKKKKVAGSRTFTNWVATP